MEAERQRIGGDYADEERFVSNNRGAFVDFRDIELA